jgi:hypothetical protein
VRGKLTGKNWGIDIEGLCSADVERDIRKEGSLECNDGPEEDDFACKIRIGKLYLEKLRRIFDTLTNCRRVFDLIIVMKKALRLLIDCDSVLFLDDKIFLCLQTSKQATNRSRWSS